MRYLVRSLLMCLVLAAACLPAAAQNQYLGEIRFVAFNFAPNGWHACDGTVLQIADYTALFAVVGTAYGGDGNTTFALPNLQGRVPLTMGQGAGLTNRNMGDAGGAEQVTLTVDQMPAHTHTANASIGPGNAATPGSNLLAAVPRNREIYSTAAPSATMNPGAIGSAGNGQPYENMPPFVTVNCIIALTGIFPSRN